MSRKNERRKRNLEKEKANAKATILPIAAALVFLVLGIVGLIRNSGYLKEYEQSEDIRRVAATVTDTKCTDDTVGERTWFTHLQYEVDGERFGGTETLYRHTVRVGESVDIEVYRRPNGKYAIPAVRDASDLAVKNIPSFVSLAAGGVLLAASAVYLALTLKKIREIRGKIQPDEDEKDGGTASRRPEREP